MDQTKKLLIPSDTRRSTLSQQMQIRTTNPDQLDREFYVKAYKDVKPRFCDPFNHYYNIGKQEDRLPNANKFDQLYPQFDASVYASNNSDLSKFTPEELMSHYHHHGRFEGRIFKHITIKITQPNQSNQPIQTNQNNLLIQRSKNDTVPKVLTNLDDKIIEIPQEKYIDITNFNKIGNYASFVNDIALDPLLIEIIEKKDPNRPVYLVLSEWGYPPFGGGEWWLIDTAKWLYDRGFACYYIYFNDPVKNSDFNKYEMMHLQSCTYIKFLRDMPKLLKFVSLLNPSIISNQGIKRLDYMRIANLLEKPFITGFCFWQDIIKMNNYGHQVFNQNMMDKILIPDEKFTFIYNNSTACYVASQFMADIVKKVHNIDTNVINTISDESQYKIVRPDNNVYVTVVNICGLKGGNILETIINNVSLDIPFLLVDSQEASCELNKRLKKLLIERNSVEKPHKSVYIRGPIADMKNIYQQTRLLLTPSLVDESFCRVAYEGMMNNIPILSTSNGNLKYLLNGYADFLDHDPVSWYMAINQLYSDDHRLQTMSCRPKSIDPLVGQNKFINLIYQSIINQPSSYALYNSVGILCPWADQGLGIQCREYYDILKRLGYEISVFSFKPYHSTLSNPKLQADPKEWDYKNIYYGNDVREEININDFIEYLHMYKVSKMIIVETCYPKVFELARICHLLSIQVVAIPNLETLRYSEIHQHDIFDKIICNNCMTYNILSKYYPQKATLVGFRILNKNFGIDKIWSKTNSFFCSGGLNAISRKNIDKIIYAFKELEVENKIANFKLHVYIQAVEIPTHMDKYRSNNIIFSVNQRSYKEIVDLYKKHDIFIHMGDHEGLGLGFYESIVCGTPVFTIDTPPNNEIIHEGVNGWLVKCGYASLNDNKEGITYKATLSISDIKAKLLDIINHYDREQMYQSTVMDYIIRYPIELYSNQIKRMFS